MGTFRSLCASPLAYHWAEGRSSYIHRARRNNFVRLPQTPPHFVYKATAYSVSRRQIPSFRTDHTLFKIQVIRSTWLRLFAFSVYHSGPKTLHERCIDITPPISSRTPVICTFSIKCYIFCSEHKSGDFACVIHKSVADRENDDYIVLLR